MAIPVLYKYPPKIKKPSFFKLGFSGVVGRDSYLDTDMSILENRPTINNS